MDFGDTLYAIGGILVFSLVIIALYRIIKESIGKRKREEQERIEFERKREESYRQYLLVKQQEKERIEKYEANKKSLADNWGVPDKTIVLGEYDLNKEIRAYSEKRIVSILGKDYGFSSIIECHLTDNSRVEKGETTITSTGTQKTDGGSMLGRAVVGGILAGGVGAAIGGATAKRDTESTSVVRQGSDTIHHDFTVWITVKDIANPLIQIPLGNNSIKANEIVSLMNAIIAS